MAKKTETVRRLYRSENDRMIAGVAGGIAEYFGVDPILVRIVAALAILSGGGVIIYIFLWLFLPTKKTAGVSTEERVEKNAQDLSETAEKLGKRVSRGGTFGFLLIVLGIYFLMQNFRLIPWELTDKLWKLWPVFLILLGLKAVKNN